MDWRNAFDVVWHDGIMYTLISETDIDATTLLALRLFIQTWLALLTISESAPIGFQ